PSGSLLFLGRLDQQVKLRGFRIELSEIEALLSSHPSVQEAAVLLHQPSPSDPSSSRLVAFLSPRPGCQLERSALRSFASEHLPAYMVPSTLVSLDTLPHTSTGKIDRLALASLPLTEEEEIEGEESRLPQTPTEEALARLWEELLQIHPIRARDNFFSLGGHSLLAARLFARIEQLYGIRLSLSVLFGHPTVEELASIIEDKLQSQQTMEEYSLGAPASGETMLPLPRHNPGEPAPLSYGEQQLWLVSQLFKEIPIYTIPLAIRIVGELNEEALRRSLQAFMERHQLWRSSFPTLHGSPVQMVQPSPSLSLPLTDLSSLPAPEQFAAARSLVEQQARLPFDLSQAPLLRASLLRFSPHLHWLCLVIHHIIADAQTVYTVLPNELQRLYEAYSQGQEPDLPTPRCQYADYALWEQARLTPERLEQLSAFWREYLQNAPTMLALPTDHPRPATFYHRGGSYYFSLPSELASDLRKLARQEGVSLYTVMVAAFQILLYRYSQQEDFLLGTFTTNRHKRPEFEEIPGYFLNAVPLRSCISDPEQMSARELIKRTREALARTMAHDDLPLPLLKSCLEGQHSAAGSPLFQVAIAMNSYRSQGSSSWQIQELAIDNGTSRFDLTLSLEEGSDGALTGCFEYSQDLFEEQTILRLSRHWQTLLSSLVSNPSCSLSSLSLLPPE
ncbi:condensation domain-containing protein, partial [Thermogemmatispora sp.]|uniref:condensation domain-containing protein n=1 Tax=Thermogemmatispora sp. TaxID=1968838 RepID=UPI0035E42444